MVIVPVVPEEVDPEDDVFEDEFDDAVDDDEEPDDAPQPATPTVSVSANTVDKPALREIDDHLELCFFSIFTRSPLFLIVNMLRRDLSTMWIRRDLATVDT